MTNLEKYEEDIKRVTELNEVRVSIYLDPNWSVKDRKIVNCEDIYQDCYDCPFFVSPVFFDPGDDCASIKAKWLKEEYKETNND